MRRHATNFVDDFITIADGRTNIVRNGVTLGAFDNAVYRNTNLPKRDYKAPSSYPRPRPGVDGGRTFIVAAGIRF